MCIGLFHAIFPEHSSFWKIAFFYFSRSCCSEATCIAHKPPPSVCLSVHGYSGTTGYWAGRLMSDTSGFRTMKSWKIKRWFSWNDCVQEIWRENKRIKCIYAANNIYSTRALENTYPVRYSNVYAWLHPLEDAQESLMRMCIKHMINRRCGQ